MGFGRAGALLGVSPHEDAGAFRKAITSSSAPSIIRPEEADRLIDYMVDESKLWDMATVVRMNKNQKWIRILDLSSGILRPQECGTCPDTVDISATGCLLDTKSFIAAVPICDDTLEDNIEGPALEAHILRMIAVQLANELEVLGLMGNTAGFYNSPIVNPLSMVSLDGWYVQSWGGHTIDAGGATDTSGRCIHVCKFAELMKALPTKWRRDPTKLKFFMHPDMLMDYYIHVGGRSTPLGDRMITGDIPPSWNNTGIVDLPGIPTDLFDCYSGSFEATTGTFMMLTDPKNLILGIQREMKYEREREACNQRTWHIWTIRFDIRICVPDAVALYDCMSICDCGLYCQPPVCT